MTIEDSVIAAAKEQASDSGSLSAWVADAIESKIRKATKLQAMEEALAAYESEFGSISDEEAAAQIEADRANATRVRGGRVVPTAS